MKRLLALATMLLIAAFPGWAQESKCLPVSQRNGDGCWILTRVPIGEMPQKPMFWHLDQFARRAAAEARAGKSSVVVEALDRVWLLTIAGAKWRAGGGKHISTIGPIPVQPGVKYTAQYMEAVTVAGWETPVHRHPGAEVWYTESGETWLETPQGKQIGRKGAIVIVPGGEPMRLKATGHEKRRAIVLVLYDSSHPWVTMTHDWTPKGLCSAPPPK